MSFDAVFSTVCILFILHARRIWLYLIGRYLIYVSMSSFRLDRFTVMRMLYKS